MNHIISFLKRLDKGSFLKSILSIGFLIFMIIFLIISMQNLEVKEEILYSEFINILSKDRVKQVVLGETRQTIDIKYMDDSNQIKNVFTIIPSESSITETLQPYLTEGLLEFAVIKKKAASNINLLTLLPAIFIVVYLRKLTKNTFGNTNFGKTKKTQDFKTKKTNFSSIAGLVEEKESLQDIIEYLKNPKKYWEKGARIVRGVLLSGEPGTGKTLLAKAVAGEANVPFYSIAAPDVVDKYVGVGAQRVRNLFKEARQHNGPAIIFIDEIDAIGGKRGSRRSHKDDDNTLNQILVEMDGFNSDETVVVIAATNRAETLDSALLRPGRFDRHIKVGYPDKKAREDILKLHARGKAFEMDVDWEMIAKKITGFTGAHIENLINEALLISIKKDKKFSTTEDLNQAITNVLIGPAKGSTVINSKDKLITAYHESGHAIVSHFLGGAMSVKQISIVPRANLGGYTMYTFEEELMYTSKKELEKRIVSLLGGNVAEKLILQDVSSGAQDDIARASKIARDMVTKYGMSDSLPLMSYTSTGYEEKEFSETIMYKVDVACGEIMEMAKEKAEKILTENLDKLYEVAKALLEKETIETEEFLTIMNSKED
ncbi:MAG: ATP-dependent zinc metalloprotease FtsH [Clostridia bacterium]|nr:ATP-dependent zinc metalloprotease FtsH [Clostridia bacterium]MDD4375702.1 ATP-dependent zinc metalloprotease FtsH [Clostridia bacterium]